MIIGNIDLEISGYSATLSKDIKLYRGDSFTLSFSLSSILISRIDSVEISDGVLPLNGNIQALMLIENSRGQDFVSGTIIENNKINFRISEEHTQAIGINKMQIVLTEVNSDGTKEVLHTPPFEFEIKEPIGSYDIKEARVDYALVDQSSVALLSDTGDNTLIVNMGYTPWHTGELISARRLNEMFNLICENRQDIDELMYKPISITSLSLSKSSAEMGEIVINLVVNWNYNKTPTTQSFNGITLSNSVKTYTITEPISSSKTFTLSASDGKTNVSKNIAINFYNGKYYGSSSIPSTYNSDFIKSLNKQLTGSKNGNFTVNCGSGQYIYFAIPTRFGKPSFSVGGFSGGFDLIATIDFTNNFNYTEPYYIYKSGNSNLGNTTVTVS